MNKIKQFGYSCTVLNYSPQLCPQHYLRSCCSYFKSVHTTINSPPKTNPQIKCHAFQNHNVNKNDYARLTPDIAKTRTWQKGVYPIGDQLRTDRELFDFEGLWGFVKDKLQCEKLDTDGDVILYCQDGAL